MSKFHITFSVKGDAIAGDLVITREKIECETLDEMVEITWKDYKEALRYIWKRLEADIKCEARPHENFSLICFKTNDKSFHYGENVVLDAFFRKRMKEFSDMHPHWTDRS